MYFHLLTRTHTAGLERLLRFIQTILQILTAWPSLIASLLQTSSISATITIAASLDQLQSSLNLTRRSQRLFWFLGSFKSGWDLYTNQSDKSIETWLDIYASTFLGLFGMIESVTLLDLLELDHLTIFGPERTLSLNMEAQKIWFAGLALSAMSSGIKMVRLMAYRPVPPTGSGFGTGAEPDVKIAKSSEEKDALDEQTGEKLNEGALEDMKKEREQRKAQQKAWLEKVNRDVRNLTLSFLTDVLDLLIPASTVGWIQAGPGPVGVTTLLSSITSGLTVWEKFGRRVGE